MRNFFADDRGRVDEIWGTIGLSLVFVPGIIAMFPEMVAYIYKKEWRQAFGYFIVGLTFPILFLVLQFAAIMMTCCKSRLDVDHMSFITRFTGIEAAVESCGQLLLQIFTILYNYETGKIQKITIITSFIQLAKCTIMQDVENKIYGTGKELSFQQLLE